MTIPLLIGFSLMAQLVDPFPQFPQFSMFPQMPMLQLPPSPVFPTFPPFPKFTLPPPPPNLFEDSPLFNRSDFLDKFLLGAKAATTIITGLHSGALIFTDKDIEKIQEMCLSRKDRRKILPKKIPEDSYDEFILAMIETIGLNELRSELKFEPLPPWKPWNKTEAEEERIPGNLTIEEFYYHLEPKSEERSLDNKKFTEEQMYSSIGHLEKQIPLVRKIFKDGYEKSRGSKDEEPEPKKEAEPKKSEEDYESDEEEEERKKKEKLKPKPKPKPEEPKPDRETIPRLLARFSAVSKALAVTVEQVLESSKSCMKEKRKEEEEEKKKKKKKEETTKKSSEEKKEDKKKEITKTNPGKGKKENDEE